MLLPMLLVLVVVGAWTLATYFYEDKDPICPRIAAGTCTGLAVFGLLAFLLSSVLGMRGLSIALAVSLASLPILLLFQRTVRCRVRQDLARMTSVARGAVRHPSPSAVGAFAVQVLLAAIVWLVFHNTIFEREDGIYTAVVNNTGDLPFHLSAITRFAYGNNYPPEHPSFAGAPFTYSFLVDVIAAVFVRAGADLRKALLLENLLLAFSFLGLFYSLTRHLTGSKTAALMSVILVVFSGGLGWLLLFEDIQSVEGGLPGFFSQVPQHYTINSAMNLRWGNCLTALLVPQRSMLMGLPLAMLIFKQWWHAAGPTLDGRICLRQSAAQPVALNSPRDGHDGNRMLVAGVLAGMLPLAHLHSFAAVLSIGLCLSLLLRKWDAWVRFYLPAGLVGMVSLLLVPGALRAKPGFLGWHIGWDHGNQNILVFWLINTGLALPLIVVALIRRTAKVKGESLAARSLFGSRDSFLVSRGLALFYLPFLACLVLPNVVRLAPWIWDNIKVLFYWYLASVPLIALAVVHFWRRRGLLRGASVAMVLCLTLAGALDVLSVITRADVYRQFESDALSFAETIKQVVPENALVLHAPIHNHPVVLTGRRSFMAYPGHLWSQGLDPTSRRRNVNLIYAGAPGAEQLIDSYGIDYVVIGPAERATLEIRASFFGRYSKVIETGQYSLYATRR